MPQFAPDAFLPQLFWLGLIFAVLYFFVVRPTLPKVGRVIDAREGQVAGDLDAAETAKGEADTIRITYDAGMEEARKTAQAEVAAAREAAARAAEVQLAAAAAEVDGRIEAAMARIALARGAAEATLATAAAELTADAVTRVAGLDVSQADVDAALDGKLAGTVNHG